MILDMLRRLDTVAGRARQPTIWALRHLSQRAIHSPMVPPSARRFISRHSASPLPNSTHWRGLMLSCVQHTPQSPQPQPHLRPEEVAVKPYDAIPTPKRIPLLGISTDFMKFSPTKAPLFIQQRVEQLGKIYREKAAPGLPEFLFVLDPEDVSKVFRADGKHPRRFPLTEWTTVKKENNIPIGLFLS